MHGLQSSPRPPALRLLAIAAGLALTSAAFLSAAAQSSPPAGNTSAGTTASGPTPRIVNGLDTQAFPTAGALLEKGDNIQFCSAVLVGCQTALTAAHCVCSGGGSQCQAGGGGLVKPASIQLFLQNAGFFDVQSIAVPPQFQFGVRDDVAVLRLSQPVTGIRPTPLNSIEKLALGSDAEIVGFGLAAEGIFDNGLKRTGHVTTEACEVVDTPDEYICWEFSEPVGPPGEDTNTCSGDSGGPMYFDFGGGEVLAGIGSGGLNADCQPDDLPFDLEIFTNRGFIAAAAGADLGDLECGNLPVVGGPGQTQIDHSGEITQAGQIVDRQIQVPAGARSLRVALNAEEGLLINELTLTLHAGGAPPVGTAACQSDRDGGYEYCEVGNPVSGAWNARIVGVSGDGRYQLTTTILREVDLGPCVPGPNTLCIDDAPGDGRFEATIAFDTSQAGGTAGLGNAIELDSLGITSGGVFWFFNRENPEVLLKVLDGCDVNDHRWVFWSAGTNVRMTVTVTDRRTGLQRIYQNPDLHPALPVTDILAFDC